MEMSYAKGAGRREPGDDGGDPQLNKQIKKQTASARLRTTVPVKGPPKRGQRQESGAAAMREPLSLSIRTGSSW